MRPLPLVTVFLLSLGTVGGAAEPLQTWTVRDHLNHRWADELVHFDFEVAGRVQDLVLTTDRGVPVVCQFSDLRYDDKRARTVGRVWTVVTVEPQGQVVLELRPGKATASSDLTLRKEARTWTLANSHMAVTLANWTGRGPGPTRLTDLAGPVVSVSRPGGPALGAGSWINAGPTLTVREASTEVVEPGPVHLAVRQRLVFDDGRAYEALIRLGARQEAALIAEHADVEAPQAAFRFSLQPGLGADRVFWHNQWKKTDRADTWSKVLTELKFEQEQKVCELRPWSFWWLGDITPWAAFYRKGAETLVGVLALRPSRWSPTGWDGFDRTAVPVTTGPGGRVDLTFGLMAHKKKGQGDKETLAPLHREWAITVGTVREHVDEDRMAKLVQAAGLTGAAAQKLWTEAQWTPKLRHQLVKFSEFPLDEVKEFGFDFAPAEPGRRLPFLLFGPSDIQRVRRQAKSVPSVKARVEAAIHYIVHACHAPTTFEKEGWKAFYEKNYWGNYLIEKLPEAYLGSDDPLYGKLLVAAARGLVQTTLDTFLEKPDRPAIGAYGPWFTSNVTRLLFNYELAAGAGLLSPAERAAGRSALVFCAHFLAHPDYWNLDVGLCSANPNMTSSIRLPKGLLALALAGHPRADQWLQGAEDELKEELKDWISPGGAWIENPGYQSASLDGMFLLAQAIRRVHGRDYFADPRFRATMDYYGFILTPPDVRFPPTASLKAEHPAAPMVQPSIGDMFAGYITCFNGWMAAATAATDPAYSRRQQFYWKMQNRFLGMAGRAAGLTLALTDPDLPAEPPAELDRGFPGFGSVLRSSWTDPKASYVAHRTGPNSHHYHDDVGTIVYYAKGAPLCTDFGNCYAPQRRDEARFHNRVSFDRGGSTGELVEMRALRASAAYSHGLTRGGAGQSTRRSVLLVKSADPLGATYLVVRDTTAGGTPEMTFSWNLWCLSREPVVQDRLVRFPGQFGVDLDVHLVAPAQLQIQKDHWAWQQHIYVWGPFSEEQHGIHVVKRGPKEDYLAVLYPRTPGQPPAQVAALADGRALRISHAEGVDIVLLSAGAPAAVADGDVRLKGEVSLVRRRTDGTVRLVVLQGAACTAQAGPWQLASDGPVSLDIQEGTATGESDGQAHTAAIVGPVAEGQPRVEVDGQAQPVQLQGQVLHVPLPAGPHRFTVQWK